MNGSIGGYSEKQIRRFGACNDSIPVVGGSGDGATEQVKVTRIQTRPSRSLLRSPSLLRVHKTIKTIVKRM